jgi:hypothetical protein
MDAEVLHAKRAVEALRSGVPNRDAVSALGSTQAEIERRFRELLDAAGAGESPAGLMVGGGFGSGKSHLLEFLQHLALEQRFVASRIVVSKETPLHDPAKVFRAAADSAVVPGRQGSALTEIASALHFDSPTYTDFYRWTYAPEAGLDERFPATLYLYENLRSADREFADRIVRFWSGDPIGVSDLKRKLREAGEGATWTLGRVSVRELALQRFRFVAHMMRAAGFGGWVLLFDEVELIGRYSVLQRGKAYGEVARWAEGFELEPLEGVTSVLAITDDFAAAVIDGKLDHERLPARFRDRDEELVALRAERGMHVIESQLVHLTRPDPSALEATYGKLKEIHGNAYRWEPPELGRDELLSSRAMREYVRAWINEWDLRRLDPAYQPEISFEEFEIDYGEDAALETAPDGDEPNPGDADDPSAGQE